MNADWVEMELGDFIELKRGYDLPKKRRQPGDIPIISSSGESDFHDEAKVKGPGVVTGRYGTIGEVFYVAGDFWPLNTALYVKDFKGNDPLFIYYLLKTISYIDYSDKAAVPGINRNHLHKAIISVPVDPVYQRDLAEKLWALDSKIELNRKTNQTLEQIAQAIFKSWFVDFEPTRAKIAAKKSGEDTERAAMAAISGKSLDQLDQLSLEQQEQLKTTAALFPDALVDSELGEIPEGWRVSNIDESTSLILDHRGKTPKKLGGDWAESGYPAISAKNIKGGRIVNRDAIRFLEGKLYGDWMKDELEPGDVFLTSEGPMGEMYFLTDETKYCLSQRLYALRANRELISPTFLYLWLQTSQVKSDLEGRVTGTTVVGIRQSELRKVNVLLPSKELAAKFDSDVFQLFVKLNNTEKENQNLEEFRDSLLPRLLRGSVQEVV